MKYLTAFALADCHGSPPERLRSARGSRAPPQQPASTAAGTRSFVGAGFPCRAHRARYLQGKGFSVGVSVIDSGGVLKVLLAQDGTSARGVQSSTNKAVTALTLKDATSHLGERVKSDAALAQTVSANPNFNVRAGGVLLKVKEQIVGAIGAGARAAAENDEACAIAGLEAIQREA